MLIGFVGAPISGKTTTAALLFAALKDAGYAVEFVPEQARVFIAQRRVFEMTGTSLKPLDDVDQFAIMHRQGYMEKLFHFTGTGMSVAITDATAFLALLYMTQESRAREDVLAYAIESASRFDILFRCHPVHAGDMYDPNRVHSYEQSLVIDAQLDEVLKLAKVPAEKVVDLTGPSNVRASRAKNAVLEKMVTCRH